MSNLKNTATPAALVAAILLWIFGKRLGGVDVQTLGTALTGLLAAITAAVHGPNVKKVVGKLPAVVKRIFSKKLTMYDSTDIAVIPSNPQAVAGYTAGYWPTYDPLVKKFPKAFHLSIAIKAADDADCLDIENGDATPDQAPEWVLRQRARGVHRPMLYASVSVMPAVIAALKKAGIPRTAVVLWTAHYTYSAHLCTSKCWHEFQTTADLTQYSDKAMNRNLDASLVGAGVFG